MRWRGKTGAAVLALAVAAALGYGFWPRPVPVTLARAERGELVLTVTEEGQTRVRERYTVSAPVDAYARRIGLEPGDAVEEGELLVALDPIPAQVLDPRSLARAEAQVGAARRNLAVARQRAEAAEVEAQLARTSLARTRALREDGFASQAQLDEVEAAARRAEAALRSARLGVEVARFELEGARTALRFTDARPPQGPQAPVRLESPVAGRVLRVHHESAGAVRSGEPLIEIGNPGSLEVVVDVLSADAVRIAPGSPVVLQRWGGEQDLQGVVREVEPSAFTKVSALGVEEQRVNVLVDIVSPPQQWRRLADNYRVEATFQTWRGEKVLQVPDSALVRVGEGWGVYRVRDGVARLQPVKLGRRNGLRAQILDGLAAGDVVVAFPDRALADGVRVRAAERGPRLDLP